MVARQRPRATSSLEIDWFESSAKSWAGHRCIGAHHRDYCHSCYHMTIIYSCSLSSSWRRGCEMHLRGCWPDGRANTGFTTTCTIHLTIYVHCALLHHAPCTMHYVPYAMHHTLHMCYVLCAPCTMHHAPCTMHHVLCTVTMNCNPPNSSALFSVLCRVLCCSLHIV